MSRFSAASSISPFLKGVTIAVWVPANMGSGVKRVRRSQVKEQAGGIRWSTLPVESEVGRTKQSHLAVLMVWARDKADGEGIAALHGDLDRARGIGELVMDQSAGDHAGAAG
jgi:hypothetical protein